MCFIHMRFTCEPRHKISNNVVCSTSKALDQPAHTPSLIRAFASRLNEGAQWLVVECLTRDRGVPDLSLTGVTVLWSLSKTHLS